MTLTFYAEDNEFGVATGDNVNSGNGTSTFDYPPTSTLDLVITSHEDDDNPRLFEVGEAYSLSFEGNGGTTLEDATVIRSDPFSGNKGAVVFEGTNPQGEVVQVVWSPNFDLEQWYFDNFQNGQSPGFYNYDRVDPDYGYACFAAGTLVRTVAGVTPVERIAPGDLVPTLDGAVEPVLWVASSTVPGFGRAAPVTVMPGILGATAPVVVSPQHRILIRDARCEAHFGTAEVFVAAGHLVDGHAIQRSYCKRVTYHHLLFERHEVISASGLYSESLLLGDDMRGVMSEAAHDRFEADFGGRFPKTRMHVMARRVLRRRDAPLVRSWLGLKAGDDTRPPPSFLYAA
ncbi:Hint domain-containing protein [Tateyamaria sp. ANG-S1]|uniref:Hint domain-containing protein n=1 Tax=Tateyamaria sp. ANG-S1 TaxID=1577905 RepID=UPI00068C3A3B|nr:Hint domain-containing protein [Tateyamaria sp. ANG-S1]